MDIARKIYENTENRPEVLVSASAIGIYGNRGDELLTESTAPQPGDFMSDTCVAWEHAAEAFPGLGIRCVRLRIGVVLSTRGGALSKMLPSYPFGIGAYFGDGRQWFSWVHLEDMARMFVFALENKELHGPFNAVAPHPMRNKDFARAIGDGMGKKALLLPVPTLALRCAMGQMADVVLHSAKVDSGNISRAGFHFEFETAEKAVQDLVARKI